MNMKVKGENSSRRDRNAREHRRIRDICIYGWKKLFPLQSPLGTNNIEKQDEVVINHSIKAAFRD